MHIHFCRDSQRTLGDSALYSRPKYLLMTQGVHFGSQDIEIFSDVSWFSDCKQGTSLDDVDINLVLNGTTTTI